MKIVFDTSIPIVGIGVVPWARLGPERWFDNYEILSVRDWDLNPYIGSPQVRLFEPAHSLPAKNVQSIVADQAFADLCKNTYQNRYFIPYKPVETTDELRMRFLMNDTKFTDTFENKAAFREQFADILPFAPFKIFDHTELRGDQDEYESMRSVFEGDFVLQHERLSGGKGTYLIREYTEYTQALRVLPKGKIVVSRLFDGGEYSVQVCATQYGAFAGEVQKQIIRDPQLCNFTVPDVRMFCGGEIGTTQLPEAVRERIQRFTRQVGDAMYEQGYRGIFGIDMLIKGEQVVVLEVNARLTGMTPLLTALYRDQKDVPFYLLHVLELGGFEYTIEDKTVEKPQTGALFILQSHIEHGMELEHTVESGVYTHQENGELNLKRRDANFDETDTEDDVLVQAYVPAGSRIEPADRMAVVITRKSVLQNDEISASYRELIARLYEEIRYKTIAN